MDNITLGNTANRSYWNGIELGTVHKFMNKNLWDVSVKFGIIYNSIALFFESLPKAARNRDSEKVILNEEIVTFGL